MLERNDEAMRPEPLPGYVWLDTPGKRLHVCAADLELPGQATVSEEDKP